MGLLTMTKNFLNTYGEGNILINSCIYKLLKNWRQWSYLTQHPGGQMTEQDVKDCWKDICGTKVDSNGFGETCTIFFMVSIFLGGIF